MLARRLFALAGLILIPVTASPWWQVRDRTPTTAQITVDFNLKSKPVTASFLVNFMHAMNCAPEVSVVINDGSNLGEPVSQQWAKSKMKIWIDNKEVWQERTAITNYTNAVEAGGIATTMLIKSIIGGTEAIVQAVPELPILVFPLKESAEAIKKAQDYCAAQLQQRKSR